jgi:hypothetical protein
MSAVVAAYTAAQASPCAAMCAALRAVKVVREAAVVADDLAVAARVIDAARAA